MQAIYVPEDVSPGHGPADPGQYVAGRTGRTRHPSLRQNISNDHELISNNYETCVIYGTPRCSKF